MDPFLAFRVEPSPAARLAMTAGSAAAGRTEPRNILPTELELIQPGAGLPPVHGTEPAEGSFGSLLNGLVKEVNARQHAAADTVKGLLSGEQVSLHQAMIALEEASVSFQLMVEVRNKLLESYQELMRMQV
jgi:flagellar hook-basal body complex protein FliE